MYLTLDKAENNKSSFLKFLFRLVADMNHPYEPKQGQIGALMSSAPIILSKIEQEEAQNKI
jgi:hypothetical protein